MNKGKYRAFITKVEGKVEGPKDYSKEAQEWLAYGLIRAFLIDYSLSYITEKLRVFLASGKGSLSLSFKWSLTPEGHNYWSQRSDKVYPLSGLDRAKLEALLEYLEEYLWTKVRIKPSS